MLLEIIIAVNKFTYAIISSIRLPHHALTYTVKQKKHKKTAILIARYGGLYL